MPGNPRTPQEPRKILLVDCDMFFVQVARLEDPDGVGREKLLLVGGAGNRGVVTSASYEARAFGVRSGMPTARALRLCPEAVTVPVPRSACVERSRAVRHTLRELAPVVQSASIDEFYLDLTGTERMLDGEPLEDSAWRIRNRVLEETMISVSLGGGTQRLIAKLATRIAKPAGVHVVPPGSEQEFMRGFRLADLPGVGPSLLAELASKGLESVEDILAVEDEWLERWFGAGRGRWLWNRARGIDPSEVTSSDPRKSISSERTFGVDLTRDEDLERMLFRLVGSVGSTLRKGSLRARTITVKLRDGDFTTRQASHTLPEPIESDHALLAVARTLLNSLRAKRRTGARLLGVAVSNLSQGEGGWQLGLFESAGRVESDRDRLLSRVTDRLKERFGEAAIQPGRVLSPPERPPKGRKT